MNERAAYVMAMAILQSELYRDADDELKSAVDSSIDLYQLRLHGLKPKKNRIYAKLLVDKHYPAAWVFNYPVLKAGTIVPVVEATNMPADDNILYWVDTPELHDDAYGIGLGKDEFELIAI